MFETGDAQRFRYMKGMRNYRSNKIIDIEVTFYDFRDTYQ